MGFQVAPAATAQGLLPIVGHLDEGEAGDTLQHTTGRLVDAALASQVTGVVIGYGQVRLAEGQPALVYLAGEVLGGVQGLEAVHFVSGNLGVDVLPHVVAGWASKKDLLGPGGPHTGNVVQDGLFCLRQKPVGQQGVATTPLAAAKQGIVGPCGLQGLDKGAGDGITARKERAHTTHEIDGFRLFPGAAEGLALQVLGPQEPQLVVLARDVVALADGPAQAGEVGGELALQRYLFPGAQQDLLHVHAAGTDLVAGSAQGTAKDPVFKDLAHLQVALTGRPKEGHPPSR